MFCGPGSAWGGWHMGGWLFPGFFMMIFAVLILWLMFKRQSAPAPHDLKCPQCSGAIHPTYFRCPHCGENLKHNCPNCSRIIEHDWSYCPYCNEQQTLKGEKTP